jgi:hypothetical protein
MADNTTLNIGAGGDVIATDDIGGVKFQRFKLIHGADGVNDGDISNANPLPTNMQEVGGAALTLGAKATSASVPVALPLDAVVGSSAAIAALNVDLLTGNASGWYDASQFHSVSVQIVGGAGISAGAIFFEQTNDTSAAAAGNVWPVEEDTTLTPTPQIAAITIAASTTRMFRSAVTARYVRVRVSTGFTGGTVQAVAVFSQVPYSRMVQTVAQATAGNMNATVAGSVTATPVNPTNASIINSAASTNGTVIKGSAGNLYGITASNNGAGVAWVKLHNSATVTVGSTAVAQWFAVPAGGSIQYDWGPLGARFSTGICLSITGAVGDTDTTAVTAGQVKVITSFI